MKSETFSNYEEQHELGKKFLKKIFKKIIKNHNQFILKGTWN